MEQLLKSRRFWLLLPAIVLGGTALLIAFVPDSREGIPSPLVQVVQTFFQVPLEVLRKVGMEVDDTSVSRLWLLSPVLWVAAYVVFLKTMKSIPRVLMYVLGAVFFPVALFASACAVAYVVGTLK